MTNAYYHIKLYTSKHSIQFVCIVVSIILHVFLITEFTFKLPELFEDRQIIQATLMKNQPIKSLSPSAVASPPLSSIVKQTEPESPLEDSTVTDSPAEASLEPASTSIADTVSEEINTQTSLSSATLNMASQTSVDTTNDNSDNKLINTVEKNLDLKSDTIPYTHAETEFEIRRGLDTSVAGSTSITFNIDNNGAYTIYSLTQAKGLASLFFGNLVQKSNGNITDQGLRPDFYSYQYGNDLKKQQSANFNWNDRILMLNSSKGNTSVQLQEGTQDLLSFMYQFMFAPPLNDMKISMTNGKKISTYYYSFEGEEVIQSKLGEIRTIHLLKDGSKDEKTEIWLAIDYQYLPVKIRKIEKDGTVIEQLAIKLTVN